MSIMAFVTDDSRTTYRLSEYDDEDDKYTAGSILFQRRSKSVSFFDIDTVHYYNSDDCSSVTTCTSDSSEDTNTTLTLEEIEKEVRSKMQANSSADHTTSCPYTRLDLPFKISSAHLSALQICLHAEIDPVGEFFEGVYMYEVWTRPC